MTEPSLGLVMILRDEERNLERSLAPVAGAFDEVVAVDTGSQDRTRDICRRLGARVYQFAWQDDFAQARNHCLDQARADWLFWLDGDNAITPQAVEGLRRLIPEQGPAILWALERVVPGGQQLWQKRCFPRDPRVRFSGRVHEQLVHPEGWPQVPTPVVIEHWGYQDPSASESKGRYYQGLLSQMLSEAPEDFYAHFQMARCHLNLGQPEAARGHLEAVLASPQARQGNPQLWAQAHFLLAGLWQRLGRPERAERLLDELLAQVPRLGLAHYHRGRLAYGAGLWGLAAQHLAQALELGLEAPLMDLDPQQTLFMAEYLLGRCQQELGQPRQAAQALSRALERRPENTAARTELAQALLRLGQPEQARQELARVLRLRPGDRRAAALLKSTEQAA